MDWISIEEQIPPKKRLKVKDDLGGIYFAEPTYFPFDVVKFPGDESKPYGFRGTLVWHENNEELWDGGWLVDFSDLNFKKVGKILFFQEI